MTTADTHTDTPVPDLAAMVDECLDSLDCSPPTAQAADQAWRPARGLGDEGGTLQKPKSLKIFSTFGIPRYLSVRRPLFGAIQ